MDRCSFHEGGDGARRYKQWGPHMSEMPYDTANIQGFCLSGWNTNEFYCLPLANLYFLKFLKGMSTHSVIKRGSKATDNTLAEGGGVGSWSSPGFHRTGCPSGEPVALSSPMTCGLQWTLELLARYWPSSHTDKAGPPAQAKGPHKGPSPPTVSPALPWPWGSPLPDSPGRSSGPMTVPPTVTHPLMSCVSRAQPS